MPFKISTIVIYSFPSIRLNRWHLIMKRSAKWLWKKIIKPPKNGPNQNIPLDETPRSLPGSWSVGFNGNESIEDKESIGEDSETAHASRYALEENSVHVQTQTDEVASFTSFETDLSEQLNHILSSMSSVQKTSLLSKVAIMDHRIFRTFVLMDLFLGSQVRL